MKILIVADEPEKKYWDFYTDGCLKEFDLILSCGDLPPQYLSFLVTFARCPLFYVHGNHDDCYAETPPDGCECIEDKIITYNGLRIMGLGGSNRYKLGENQYNEEEMQKRIRKMRRQLKKNNGFDLLLTHAPARHLNDAEDIPHRGFESFNTLLETYNPKYFIHGHVHLNYGHKMPRITERGETKVINAYYSYILEI